MSSTLQLPKLKDLKPRITVIGVGGAGGNAINNMIASGIDGVDFIAANTDAQALLSSSAERRIQLGADLTEGLGAGARPEIGEAAAREAINEIKAAVEGSHMVFIAAGMGGGTGTGAASVVAKAAREMGILTVAIVTKPFNFEGNKRMRTAEAGIEELRNQVDTLIVIPNQNLFRIANERTTFAEAFLLADQVLHSGIACITDLIVREGLINLDFADVRAVMSGMGTAMMGTGEASGERRAIAAAELAILNPLLDDVSLKGAQGLLVSISGSRSLTLYEVDEAASRVREEVDPDANVIIGATFDESLGEKLRVSIVASGLQAAGASAPLKPSLASKSAAVPQPAPARAAEPTPQLYPAEPAPAWQDQAWNGGNEGQDAQPALPVLQTGDATYSADAAAWQADSDYEQGAQRQPEPQVWQGPNDVVIELGMPQAPQRSPAMTGNRDELGAAPAPEFRPQPPTAARRPARRLPEVEDFPQFAQEAYHSRRGATPAKPATSASGERRRSGFFDFLTGRRDTTDAEPESDLQPRTTRRQAPELTGAYSGAAESDSFRSDQAAGEPHHRRVPMPRHRPRQV